MWRLHRFVLVLLLLALCQCAGKRVLSGGKTHPVAGGIYLQALDSIRRAGGVRTAEADGLLREACARGNSGACFASESAAVIDSEMPTRLPLVQGFTTHDSIQVSALVETQDEPLFLLWDKSNRQLQEPMITSRSARPHSPWTALNLKFTGLKAGESYRLDVVAKDGVLRDSRRVQVLRFADPKRMTFALASCMSDAAELARLREQMWSQLQAKKPEMIFLIGDNVYADLVDGKAKEASAAQIWDRYVQTRRSFPMSYWPELVPTLAIWDDHDTGKNDSDATWSQMKEAQEIFRAFFAQESIAPLFHQGPGLAFELRAAEQSFFFLDNRSFRTPNGKPEPKAAHFGAKQEQWLLSRLRAGRGPAWLISGDQFFGAYHPFESYEGNHPKPFASFLKSLKPVRRPLVFVSGDRHLTEVMDIPKDVLGYPTFEITSSGIHAKMFPGALAENPNPRQRKGFGRDGLANFMIVTGAAKSVGTLSLQATAYGPRDETIFDLGGGKQRVGAFGPVEVKLRGEK